MDVVFGVKNYKNDIVWGYKTPAYTKKHFPRKHDSILFYAKGDKNTFNKDDVREPFDPKSIKRSSSAMFNAMGGGKHMLGEEHWAKGKVPEDWWHLQPSQMYGKVSYPTQKPTKLLERIIKASSNKGDIVLDVFCGSGTTLAVAKALDRKYIGCDISKDAIEIATKRLGKTKTQLTMM